MKNKIEEIEMRNRKVLIFFISYISLLIFFASGAIAQSTNAEKIISFDGEIKINTDSTINVTEKIAYDFGAQQKHGIFRFIPIKYKARGGNYNLRISNIKVSDDKGSSQKFAVSHKGDNIEIKIGDAEKFVTGEKAYVINYTVRRAVNYFSDHDELYWNFTGNAWQIPIEKASAKIILPENATKNLESKCYEGYFGSTAECETAISGNSIEYSSGTLGPGSGMTIVAGWPKGVTRQPPAWKNMLDVAGDNWTLFTPILVFLLMFRLWWKKGRDPKGRGTIIAEYEPPDGLAPAEVGTMLDGMAGNKDVSATIIDLAVRGFLKIKRTEEKGFLTTKADYAFTKLKKEEPPKIFEKEVMKGIFGNAEEKKLSELKNKFYKSLSTIKDQLYEAVTANGYYKKNPNVVFGWWIAIAIMGGSFMAFGFGMLQDGWGTASGILSGIIILIFGWLMPAVTVRGAEIKEKILGFRDFLSVTETDRLKFHNAPEKNPEMFEKFLPYAMVLGVEKEWAKQFEGIYDKQPDWYEDSSGRAFNAIILSSMASDFSSSAMTTMSSQPSSASGGGSGFSGGGSGGGFGGGGGGSW